MKSHVLILFTLGALSLPRGVVAMEKISLPATPALSPDGQTLVFEWDGDLWSVPSTGGEATPLTHHPAEDLWPTFSPDGKEIAFVSRRDEAWQAYVMPAGGGRPAQLTHHSEGCTTLGWFPDGGSVLVRAKRDQVGFDKSRFFKVAREGPHGEELLFDAYGREVSLSPDGSKLLFTREGVRTYRKGYRGSGASQIWLYDFKTRRFERVVPHDGGCRTPMWKPDGRGFYYVGAQSGCFNIWSHDLETGEERQLTSFEEDAVILPALSADGKTMVFRNLFDFYRFHPEDDAPPVPLELWSHDDRPRRETRRRWYDKAWNNDDWGSLDFTDEGLTMTLTAGGDLWVMDTVLREPVAITTNTASHETEAVFTPDGASVFFLADTGDRTDIWKATRSDDDLYWWRNRTFELERITNDEADMYNLSVSPDGTRLACVRNRGDLHVMDLDGNDDRLITSQAASLYYDWSPDGQWLVCTFGDSDKNYDVWILSADASVEPYNVSRQPHWDGAAVWSPDGKAIAYLGKTYDRKTELHYVWLAKEDDNKRKRDRSLEEALEKMKGSDKKKEETPEDPEDPEDPETPKDAETPKDEEDAEAPEDSEGAKDAEPADNVETNGIAEANDLPAVHIDFDGLADRVHHVEIKDASPDRLFWSYDSKALVFCGTVKGRKGTYKLQFPDKLEPEFMTDKTGSHTRWIEEGSKILWMVDGVPHHFKEALPFKVYQHTDWSAYQRLGFRQIWRAMRDSFYDEHLNNRDWDAILTKYEDQAAQAPDMNRFSKVVELLLGELNASHMGFTVKNARSWSSGDWKVQTSHLGLRFDLSQPGPGLVVASVIPDGPTDQVQSLVSPGERVLQIDDVEVGSGNDLTPILTGRYPRDIRLRVAGVSGEERDVTVRHMDYGRLRRLMRDERIDGNRKRVEELSQGTLGYLDIERMNWSEFRAFEKEVFAEGFGKDGLVIDVRDNPGGFISDHVLAVLCHPRHAVTVLRGGVEGYPAGYLVYARWEKPIVVLCNQNSTSNAEILSHAVKTLKRGHIVGAPTEGSVISTPRRQILDLGELAVPDRGWYTIGDGRDMERNGVVPDHIIWPEPGEMPAGKDRQLEKAVEVLLEDVKAEKARAHPPLVPASQRAE